MADGKHTVTQGPERKYIDLSEFKQLTDGNGGFSGHASVFGKLDSADDIVLRGAYVKTTPDFIRDGWIAPDHTWGVKDDVGIVTAAAEDGYGYRIDTGYHPTADAQSIREKVNNRLANGKSVKLSIGYSATQFRYVSGKDAVQYLINPTPEDVTYCESRPRVRLLEEIKLYEVSLVSRPALMAADVLDGKQASGASEVPTIEAKAQYLGDAAEIDATVSAIARLNDRLMWYVIWQKLYDDASPLEDRITYIAAAFDEFRDISLSIIRAIMAGEAAEDEATAAKNLRALYPDPGPLTDDINVTEHKGGSRAGIALVDHSSTVRAAVKGYIQRLSEIGELRFKEGRTFSTANLTTFNEILADIRTAADRLEDVLEKGKTKEEKADGSAIDHAAADYSAITTAAIHKLQGAIVVASARLNGVGV